MSTERGSEAAQGGGEGWSRALLKAAAVLALSWIGFLFIPSRFLSFLTTRVGPNVRDALVAGWVVLFFIALTWGFIALQRRWGR